jgi:hypothetical protein
MRSSSASYRGGRHLERADPLVRERWGSNGTRTGAATYSYDQALSGCTGPANGAADEAANTKYTCADGLDRLISVTEPDAATCAAGTVTTYGFLMRVRSATRQVRSVVSRRRDCVSVSGARTEGR